MKTVFDRSFTEHSTAKLPVNTKQTHNELWQVDKKRDFPV